MDPQLPQPDSQTPKSTYFELSWSILSSIGLFVTFVGVWTLFISRPSPLTYIPIVVSVSCAIANGACYFAFYTNYAILNRAAASGFADFFWLIQEAGLSFYSYQILIHTLRNTARVVFLCVFWFLIFAISALRITILVYRVLDIASGADTLLYSGPYQSQIGKLHVGYFTTIAVVETWSSFFLIRLLHNAYRVSPKISSTRFVFRYLMRTTEIRVASLCFIGITRAVTYSTQTTSQSATTVAGQIDRFTYTMECLFPLVLLIDTLSSKKINQDTQLESFSTFDPVSSSPARYRNIQTHTEPLPPIPRHSRWLSSLRGHSA
ncbi:uncharacterized protein APUU_50271S [Aspergillus puulaauensis]|uniref:Uncharacterized protein n=1 Tax=Aspergillus puulaauensis TaxID=1220207 RepID=A0A7R7XQ19_9EURO|nr:uncharacterized protein APUU_50271S [Aspergillus puulaauensis]BCS25560.1 hypothetical protein APUU_50271S [Aspergillus puulaauensis]